MKEGRIVKAGRKYLFCSYPSIEERMLKQGNDFEGRILKQGRKEGRKDRKKGSKKRKEGRREGRRGKKKGRKEGGKEGRKERKKERKEGTTLAASSIFCEDPYRRF